MLTAAAVDAVLRACMPAKGGDAMLDYVDAEVRGDIVVVTLRLFTYEDGAVRDIKEQQVVFAPSATPLDRFTAYAQAWSAALARVFFARDRAAFDTVMPHDLVFTSVLALKKAHTVDDFARALAQKSRLGPAAAGADEGGRGGRGGPPPPTTPPAGAL